jgi:multiple sugar transport system permease protein
MPSILPAIAIFIIISGLVNPNTGRITRLFYLSQYTPLYALFPIILSLWTIGPGFLIMLGAMQAVPKELYESGRVDGAGSINRFVSITIPMCSPAIFFKEMVGK